MEPQEQLLALLTVEQKNVITTIAGSLERVRVYFDSILHGIVAEVRIPQGFGDTERVYAVTPTGTTWNDYIVSTEEL